MNAACSGEMPISGMPAPAAARFSDWRKSSSRVVRAAMYSKCRVVTSVDVADIRFVSQVGSESSTIAKGRGGSLTPWRIVD